jgi:DNA-binding FadR family transcriptional regulator
MGGLISVGLRASFRISTRSYDAGLPLHRRVLDAIRDRHPERARENMAQLLTGTREFLERELAGPVQDGAEEAGTAAR